MAERVYFKIHEIATFSKT